MLVLALIVYEIFAKQIKCRKFDLENDSQGQEVAKRGLCHLTGNIRFYIGDFFQHFT